MVNFIRNNVHEDLVSCANEDVVLIEEDNDDEQLEDYQYEDYKVCVHKMKM